MITSNDFGVPVDVTGVAGGPDKTLFKIMQAIITTACFIYPLSLAKSMSALRYISIVSIGAIIYTLVVSFSETINCVCVDSAD